MEHIKRQRLAANGKIKPRLPDNIDSFAFSATATKVAGFEQGREFAASIERAADMGMSHEVQQKLGWYRNRS